MTVIRIVARWSATHAPRSHPSLHAHLAHAASSDLTAADWSNLIALASFLVALLSLRIAAKARSDAKQASARAEELANRADCTGLYRHLYKLAQFRKEHRAQIHDRPPEGIGRAREQLRPPLTKAEVAHLDYDVQRAASPAVRAALAEAEARHQEWLSSLDKAVRVMQQNAAHKLEGLKHVGAHDAERLAGSKARQVAARQSAEAADDELIRVMTAEVTLNDMPASDREVSARAGRRPLALG